MRVQSKIIRVSLYAIFIVLLVLIRVGIAHVIQGNVAEMDEVTILEDVILEIDGMQQEVTLPHTVTGLAPRTSVKMIVNLPAGSTNSLYLHTVDASLCVMVGENCVYEYGQEGTYPEHLKDPAATSKIIAMPALHNTQTLVAEFWSPSLTDKLTITPFVSGTEPDLLRYLFAQRGTLWLFAIIQITIGLFLVFISLLTVSFLKEEMMFFWSGLFAVVSGLWVFGECDITVLFFFDPSTLYVVTFFGMFTLVIPFMLFLLSAVQFQYQKQLKVYVATISILELLAFVLQFTGIYSLRKSMYVWIAILAISLVVMLAQVLYESVVRDNVAARRLLFPTMSLGLFSVAEMFNYAIGMREYIGYLFQSGIILFILGTSFVGVLFIRDAGKLKDKQKRIEFEMKLMEYQVQMQKEHQLQVLESAKKVRAQCHDLRHQLAVIRQYNVAENRTELNTYLDTLVANIPVSQVEYCENAAVNAVVTHYVSMARQEEIPIQIGITVPARNGSMSDNNLCVVFGNLLENAIEACRLVEKEARNIHMRCECQADALVIVMDNSYDGYCVKIQDTFFSHKRQDYGIGLQSIQLVAEQHQGYCDFEGDANGQFHSNVWLHIEN